MLGKEFAQASTPSRRLKKLWSEGLEVSEYEQGKGPQALKFATWRGRGLEGLRMVCVGGWGGSVDVDRAPLMGNVFPPQQ